MQLLKQTLEQRTQSARLSDSLVWLLYFAMFKQDSFHISHRQSAQMLKGLTANF